MMCLALLNWLVYRNMVESLLTEYIREWKKPQYPQVCYSYSTSVEPKYQKICRTVKLYHACIRPPHETFDNLCNYFDIFI